MVQITSEFQVFVKAGGPVCNLGCRYCYYLKKEALFPDGEGFRMDETLLEEYIRQHIEAHPGPSVNFSWHGGEPTLLGLEYFKKIVALQHKHKPPEKSIANGLQTNGTLLDDVWCRFFAAEKFNVGLSLDGPQEFHDQNRVTKGQEPTYARVIRGYELLQKHGVPCDLLCVVHAGNVVQPIRVYRFFKQIKARYLTFLPLVERVISSNTAVTSLSVSSEAWGEFLCTVFDEWKAEDIGRVQVQIFEEAARTAFGQEHALCIFRKTCGEIPVIEHNGDFYSCDHFVDEDHRLANIRETSLAELLESPEQRGFGQAKWDQLPEYCRKCEVLPMCYGGCPKDRFLRTPGGEEGLNYLCAGYRRFFSHCRPFVEQVSALWRERQYRPPQSTGQKEPRTTFLKVGRNDPCPCGSGLKYKKCCLGK
ncbi:MAG: anaerobic sulfatase maturase [Thermodesulfobacteriota bacterium]